MFDMNQNKLLVLDINSTETEAIRESFSTMEKKLKNINGESVKFLLDFHSLRLTNELMEILTGFYSASKTYISDIAACGTGSGVRRIILESTGIPFLFAEDQKEGREMLEDQEKDLLQ
ncbi:MAG: hypothetical protein EH225_06590 [Calditrichaeota bacterium]|nr:MAG: hypothetical protein EH225_06590 [Calditrichota bacterium]